MATRLVDFIPASPPVVAGPRSNAGVADEPDGAGDLGANPAAHDLKGKTARGTLISTFWMTDVIGTSFILNGAAVQRRATLQRAMRFAVLSVINMASIVASIAVAMVVSSIRRLA